MHSFPLYSSIPTSSFLSASHSLPPTFPHLSPTSNTTGQPSTTKTTTYLGPSTGTHPHATAGSSPTFRAAAAIIDVVQDQPFHFSFAEHLLSPGDSVRSFSADPTGAESWVRLFKAGKLVYGFVPAGCPQGRTVISIAVVSATTSSQYNLSFELFVNAAPAPPTGLPVATIPVPGTPSPHVSRTSSPATNSATWYLPTGYSSSLPPSFASTPRSSTPVGPRAGSNSLRTASSLAESSPRRRPSGSPRKPSSAHQGSQASRQAEPAAAFLSNLAPPRSSVPVLERPSDPALYASSTRNVFASPTRRPPLTLPSWRPFNLSSGLTTPSPPPSGKNYKIRPTLRRPSVSTLQTVSSTASAFGEPLFAPSEQRPSISSENGFWSGTADYASQKHANNLGYTPTKARSLASATRAASFVGASSPTKSSSRDRLSSTLSYARSSPTRKTPSRASSTGAPAPQGASSLRALSSSLPAPEAPFVKAMSSSTDVLANVPSLSAQASPIVTAWATPSPTKKKHASTAAAASFQSLGGGGGMLFSAGVHSRSSSATSTITVNRKTSFTSTPLSQTVGMTGQQQGSHPLHPHHHRSPRSLLATPPRSASASVAQKAGQHSPKKHHAPPMHTKLSSEFTSWRSSSLSSAAAATVKFLSKQQPPPPPPPSAAAAASFAILQGQSLSIDLKADLQHIGDYPHTFTTDPAVKWISWASPNHSTLKATAPSTFAGTVGIQVKVLTTHGGGGGGGNDDDKQRRAVARAQTPVGAVSYPLTLQLSVLPRKQQNPSSTTGPGADQANNTIKTKKNATMLTTTILSRPSMLSRITTSSSSTTATTSTTATSTNEPALTTVVTRGDRFRVDLRPLLRHPDDAALSLRTNPAGLGWLRLVHRHSTNHTNNNNHPGDDDDHDDDDNTKDGDEQQQQQQQYAVVVGRVPVDCAPGQVISVAVEAQRVPRGVRKFLARRPVVNYTVSMDFVVSSPLFG